MCNANIGSLEDKHFLYHVKKLMQQKNEYERDLIKLSFTVHKLRNRH